MHARDRFGWQHRDTEVQRRLSRIADQMRNTSQWPYPTMYFPYGTIRSRQIPRYRSLPMLNTAALISACLIKHSPLFHPPTGPHRTSTRFPSRFHRPCKYLLVVSSVSVPVRFRPPAENHRSSGLRLLVAGVAPWRRWRHTQAANDFIHAFIAY